MISSHKTGLARGKSPLAELVLNESSNSVPIAQPLHANSAMSAAAACYASSSAAKEQQQTSSQKGGQKTPTLVAGRKTSVSSSSAASDVANESSNGKVSKFVFSPVGYKSFVTTAEADAPPPPPPVPTKEPPAGKGGRRLSSSSSKADRVVKTPENTGTALASIAQSPRSLRPNLKRKLELGNLIDYAPSQEFVEIGGGVAKPANSLSKPQPTVAAAKPPVTEAATAPAAPKPTTTLKTYPIFKPLTEHQKEMRRKRSFIPSEMQASSAASFDMSNDVSQMSQQTTDTNTSSAVATQREQTPPKQQAVATSTSEQTTSAPSNKV